MSAQGCLLSGFRELWDERRGVSEFIFWVIFFVAVRHENTSLALVKLSYHFLRSFLGQFWINLFGVVLIGAFGLLLYSFRRWKRAWYGIIEVSFALAYGWNAINKVATVGYVETISIIASVYLVVRGVDNYMKGKAAEKAAEIARFHRAQEDFRNAQKRIARDKATSKTESRVEL
jgi:hypothetical protein